MRWRVCEDTRGGFLLKPERRARILVGLFLFIIVFGPLFANLIDLLVNWLWFSAEGYDVLYSTTLKAQIELSALAGMGFIFVVGLNLLIARRVSHRAGFRVYREFSEFPALERLSEVFGWVIIIGVLLVGTMVGQWGVTHWQEYLLATHAVPMGQADPLFGIDLGFFLFQLPFRWFLYHLAFVTLIGCFLSTVFLYLVQGGVAVTPRGPVIAPAARTCMRWAPFCSCSSPTACTSPPTTCSIRSWELFTARATQTFTPRFRSCACWF